MSQRRRPGMARGNSSQEADRIEARRREVAKLRAMGFSMTEIAAQVRAHRQTVSADLKALRIEWQKERTQSYDQWVASQLADLRLVQQTALKDYRESGGETVTTTTCEGPHGVTTTTKRERRSPDARFLETFRKTVADISALLGTDDPAAFHLRQAGTVEGNEQVVEIVVDDREQLEAFRDEAGHFSLEGFREAITAARTVPPAATVPDLRRP